MKALGFTPENGLEVEVAVRGTALVFGAGTFLQLTGGGLLMLGHREEIVYLNTEDGVVQLIDGTKVERFVMRGILLQTPSGWYVRGDSGSSCQLTWPDQETLTEAIVTVKTL